MQARGLPFQPNGCSLPSLATQNEESPMIAPGMPNMLAMNYGLRGCCDEPTTRLQVTIMRYILAPIVALALLATCSVAHAQRQMNSYTPARPTLSPYLYLTRQQSGPFPNYQTFVQPAQQQQQINRTQQTEHQQYPTNTAKPAVADRSNSATTATAATTTTATATRDENCSFERRSHRHRRRLRQSVPLLRRFGSKRQWRRRWRRWWFRRRFGQPLGQPRT